MKKLAILSVMLFLSIFLVNAGDGNLEILTTADDLKFEKDHNTNFTFDVDIRNNGDVDLIDVTISIKDFTTNDIAFKFDQSIFNITSKETETVEVTASIDEFTKPGTYTGTIEVTDKILTDTVPIQIIVKSASSLTTVSTPIILTGNIGNASDTKTFTVTNNGNKDLTGINSTYNKADFTDEDNNEILLVFSKSDFDLTTGKSTTIDVFADIPEDTFLGKYSGLITVSNGTTSTSFILTVDAESGFLDINIDDIDPEGDIEPGEEVAISVTLDNTGDLDLEDLELDVRIIDIDDGGDLKEESSKFDLNSGKDTSKEFTFEIPLNVDEGEFDITITVNGDDENNKNVHLVRLFKNELSIEKGEQDRVQFTNVEVDPEITSCGQTIAIEGTAINTGSSNQDDMYIELTIGELSITETSTEFDLDAEDYDDREKEVSFSAVIPEDAKEGSYDIKLTAKDENGDFLGSKTTTITLDSGCTKPEEEETTEEVVTVEIEDSILEAESGDSITIPVKITNLGSEKETFTIEVSGYSSFAILSGIDQISEDLAQDESNTAFVSLLIDEDAEEDSYSLTITVENSAGEEVEEKTVVVTIKNTSDSIKGVPPTGFTIFDRLGNNGMTTTLMILGDLLLILVIIFFLKLILKRN